MKYFAPTSLAVLFATLTLAIPTLASAPIAQFNISVVAAGSYTGAISENALLSDFENAAGSTAAANMSCWPLDDNIGSLGTSFPNQCFSGPSNNIEFTSSSGQPDSSGFSTGNATPVMVTSNDAVSTQFASQNFRLGTDYTHLSATAGWTVTAFINPSTAPARSVDLLNTGNPSSGSGFELSLNSTGHIVATLGGPGGSVSLIGSNGDTSGNDSQVAFVTWTPSGGGAGSLALYVKDTKTGTYSTQTLNVSNYADSNTTLGIVYPASGSSSSVYHGYMEWVTFTPTPMSANTIASLITDMTGTQPPPATVVTTGSGQTHSAYAMSRNFGFDSEFDYNNTVIESYGANAALTALKFLNVDHLRDSPPTNKAPYNTCNSAYPISYGGSFEPVTSGTVGSPDQVLLTVSYVTSTWENEKSSTGCYPVYVEPGNELDDKHEAAYDNIDTTHFPSGSNIPVWGYLAATEINTLVAARNSNSKYAGILVYGPGLANTVSWPVVSKAWRLLYGSTHPAIDVAVQHSNPWSSSGDPSDNPKGGITQAQLNLIYGADSTGFSLYATPSPSTGLAPIPQTFDEEGQAMHSGPYYATFNSIDDIMAVHYLPRDVLRQFDLGIGGPLGTNWDFLGTKSSQTLGTQFTDVGWLDAKGNLKPGAYAVANMNHMLAYGNRRGGLTSITQLPFTIKVAGSNTTPSNIISYSFENDDHSYWIVLNDNSIEGIFYPNGAQSGFNVATQGQHHAFVGFTNVTISGLPNAITHAVVYQNDEYCDNTMIEHDTPWGTSWPTYPQGANTDCEQWWPAGSIRNSMQGSYPSVSGGTINETLHVNGMPMLIHVDTSQLAPIPTMTPLPYQNLATPGPGSSIPTPGPSDAPTPVPSFGPPTGSVPTPPV